MKVPQVTGMAFLKKYLINVVESNSDTISFLDMRKLSSNSPMSEDNLQKKPKNLGKMFQGSIDNSFFNRTFNDPVTSSKGSSSISINSHGIMVVNTLDNMLNMYNLAGDLLS